MLGPSRTFPRLNHFVTLFPSFVVKGSTLIKDLWGIGRDRQVRHWQGCVGVALVHMGADGTGKRGRVCHWLGWAGGVCELSPLSPITSSHYCLG